MRATKRPSDLIQSVERASQILDALSFSNTGLTVRQVADQLGLKPATVHHLVNTLEFVGFVARRGSVYVIDSAKVLDYYAALMRSAQADPLGLAAINELADCTRDTVYLSAWVGEVVAITAVAEGSHAVRVTDVYPGLSGSEHTRASGKVLLAERSDDFITSFLSQGAMERRTRNTITSPDEFLAEMDTIRRCGYAVDREEYSLGVTCIAAVLMNDGRSTGNAVAVTVPTQRFEEMGDSLIEKLLLVAQPQKSVRSATRGHAGLREDHDAAAPDRNCVNG